MKISKLVGKEPRTRLLRAALHCFSQDGYDKTSIRSIALHADVKIASISWAFRRRGATGKK
jgi:AcrR family transcriptional regulator